MKTLGQAPAAQLMECEDFEASCPGECAICLDDLSKLPAEFAFSPSRGSKVSDVAGLLLLPCGHSFHGHCAERWMAREVTCPMCRKTIGSLKKCKRLCLRPGVVYHGEDSPTSFADGSPTTTDVEILEGECIGASYPDLTEDADTVVPMEESSPADCDLLDATPVVETAFRQIVGHEVRVVEL